MPQYPETYSIYQIKRDDKLVPLRFRSLSSLNRHGDLVEGKNYDKVYSGPLSDKFTDRNSQLEDIYTTFNLYHPKDFRGHSLSVSDVVVIEGDGKASAYYCDSVGFQEVPQFFDSLPQKAKAPLVDLIQDAQTRGNSVKQDNTAKNQDYTL